MGAVFDFIGHFWWLWFIFGGGITGGVRQAVHRRHQRRLEVLEAKAKVRQAATALPEGPQPVCGCSHHLSFHSPSTSACAYEGCRCQQYVGPEPLGHVIPMPLVDPDTLTPGASLD